MGCLVDEPTALVAFLVAGSWVVRNSSDTVKVSTIILRLTDSSLYFRSDIESRLSMIIKQNYIKAIDDESLEATCRIEFHVREHLQAEAPSGKTVCYSPSY